MPADVYCGDRPHRTKRGKQITRDEFSIMRNSQRREKRARRRAISIDGEAAKTIASKDVSYYSTPSGGSRAITLVNEESANPTLYWALTASRQFHPPSRSLSPSLSLSLLRSEISEVLPSISRLERRAFTCSNIFSLYCRLYSPFLHPDSLIRDKWKK